MFDLWYDKLSFKKQHGVDFLWEKQNFKNSQKKWDIYFLQECENSQNSVMVDLKAISRLIIQSSQSKMQFDLKLNVKILQLVVSTAIFQKKSRVSVY